MPEKILLVDDEPNVLNGYRRTLRKQFMISTAVSGSEGLQKLKEEGPFAAVVSDMKMPEMNGVEFLQHVKKNFPRVIRLMLTGNADQDTAIAAINEGDVFKFLNKPCSPEQMGSALESAIEKYRINMLEKRLLQETLNGAIKSLLDVLSITSPAVFGQITHIVKRAKACARELGYDTGWELETSTRLSLIGLVTIPSEIAEKVVRSKPLSSEEQELYKTFPEAGARLIENIPRMKSVAENIRCLLADYNPNSDPKIPKISLLLRPVIDFQNLISSDFEIDEALDRLKSQASNYDPRVLAALNKVASDTQKERNKLLVNIRSLGTNMYLAKELTNSRGAILVSKNQHISASLANRLLNLYQSGLIGEELHVFMEGDSEPYGMF